METLLLSDVLIFTGLFIAGWTALSIPVAMAVGIILKGVDDE